MKLFALLGLILPIPLSAADSVLAACMVTSGNWVVGAKLPPSGLMVRVNGQWEVRGYLHPYISAAVADPKDPKTLWLSGGNGAIRARNGAREWKVTTDHTVTELRDVAADPHHAGTFYIGHTNGLAVTRDNGSTWQDATGNRPRRFTENVRVDRATPNRLISAGEDGLWLSEDNAKSWRAVGAQGFNIMRLEQSPHDPSDWIAVTMHGGPFRSRDAGRTFEPISHLRVGRYLGVDRNSYDIAYDPSTPGRIALSIWGTGVALTEDDGATWSWRNTGLPRLELWSLAFDPSTPGRLFVSVHEEALYVSDDLGKSWRKDGLPASAVYRLVWLPKESVQ